ncbi:hypothetical protein WA026_000006 [Henosepilachna vigintioctopunctata]|uniref:Uncharacterized protein n=1 Tax=Henosepilachna vigintioctopunctata TaxID=420089 RepID=A0AAW1V725_9CUCU
MGRLKNFLTSSNSKCKDTTKCLKLSDIKSKFIFAMMDKGNYYPCLILGEATIIKNGFKVYFLRQDVETEIPSTNLIPDPDVLKESEVSYVENSHVKIGVVMCLDKVKYSHTPTSFLIQSKNKCAWIPLPRVFLTKEQASALLL